MSTEATTKIPSRAASYRESLHIPATIGYYLAFIFLGLFTSVMGPAIPDLAENTHSSLAQLSRFMMAGSFGYLLGGALGGRLYDRFKGHRILAVALFLSAAFIALVPLTPLLGLLGIVLFFLGFMEGTLDVGGNSLLTWVHGEKVGPFMNGLHFFFGVGAFLAPMIIAQIVSVTDNVFGAFWLFALASLPIIVYLLRLPSPAVREQSKDDPHGPANWALVIMLVLFFFLYVGAEVGYGNWIFTYATKSSLSGEKAAAYLTSVFWGSFTLGRLVGIPISSRFKPVAIMFVDLVGCLVSMGIVLVWADSLTALWIGTFGLGFSMASIFPSAMILAGQRMHLSGQVTGFFLFGAGSGGMFLPLLIGQLIEPVGPRSMMWIVLVDLVVNLALWLGLLLYKPKLARSD